MMQTELLASVIAGGVIFGLTILVMVSFMLYRAFKEAHNMNDITGMGRHNNNSFELAEIGRSQASMDSNNTRSTRTRHGNGNLNSAPRSLRSLRSLHSRSTSLNSMQPSNNSRVNLCRQPTADSMASGGPLPDFLDPKRKKRRSRSAPPPPLRW